MEQLNQLNNIVTTKQSLPQSLKNNNGHYRCNNPSVMRPIATQLIIFILTFTIALPAFGQITAQVDRQLLGEDETLRLIIEVKGKDKDNEPDLNPLRKDFDVLGTSQSSQIQIINGQTSSSKQWQITLMPKRNGELTLPALNIGSKTTQPITIKVISSAQLNAQDSNEKSIFVEATVDNNQPYVQEQVLLTVRLYHKVQIRNGSLTQPEISNAVVEKIGEDISTRTQKDGQLYDVIERRYAIFPQQSGPLEIPSIRFEGAIPDTRRSQQSNSQFGRGFFADPFDMMQSTRTVHSRSESLKIDVAPIPSNFSGQHWLPAHSLRIQEQWSPNNPSFKVGQSVTRTITLIAEGLTAAQLPALDIPNLDKVNIYPDQSAQENRSNENGVVGLLQQKLALLPNEAGELNLPEIRIPWWNTQTNRHEVVTLPAKVITVTGEKLISNSNKSSILSEMGSEELSSIADSSPTIMQQATDQTANYWAWLSAIFAALWLVTTYLWQTERKKNYIRKIAPLTNTTKNSSLKKLQIAIQQHSQSNHAEATRNALIHWAKQRWPDQTIRCLGDIKRFCDHQPCAEEIQNLDNALYTNSSTWQGHALYPALEAWLSQRGENIDQPNKTGLPGLYERIEA